MWRRTFLSDSSVSEENESKSKVAMHTNPFMSCDVPLVGRRACWLSMQNARSCTSSGRMLLSRTYRVTIYDPITILRLRMIWSCACSFLEPRRHAEPYMQMQDRFAGIKPSCDVRIPIAQAIGMLTTAIGRPTQELRASSIVVVSTVRKQEIESK